MARGNRTGGPKTQLGKLASSKNSLKTGAYSVQQILPGERQEDFEELHKMFIDDFQPIGVVEASLVHEISLLAWKKLRLERVENQYLYGVLNATLIPEEYFAAGLPRKEEIIWLLQDLSAMTEGFVAKHQRYLNWARAAEKRTLKQEEINQIQRDDEDLYMHLKREVFEFHSGSAMQIRFIRWAGETEDEPELSAEDVAKSLGNMIKRSESVLYVHKHLKEITNIQNLIRDRRLKAFMESAGPIRAYQDLSRAFFKVLDELRKQQDWRLKNKTLES
ncbi:hypothetical protein ICV01_01700 [Polynucleobacter sp. MWH-Spelu-300-X4]|uniref:hypothetical protein n=1 Tax=Polynucleobacter sp. MWH-Spelu-300-X4 TaxID=2689109 RepID=UPI001BFE1276|nr:hypothetical protein [Polynucleobacter sp. MWH-Spelu-300-X4]QWD80058.1 hypothetical protein ICV01_01700 [Polynucleobacter sp. MWH-Spelu-300-X4]